MRKTLCSIFVLLVLAACGTSGAVGDRPQSGVRGRVLLGPQCPVVQAGSPCPDKPVAAEVQVFEMGSDDLVTSTDSGEDGRFRIDLEPGSYELLPIVSGAGGLPFGKRVQVKVEPGEYAGATLSLDSGIR